MKKVMLAALTVLFLFSACSMTELPEEVTISKMFSSTRYEIPVHDIQRVMSLIHEDYDIVDEEDYQFKTSSLELSYQIDGKKYGLIVTNDNTAVLFVEDEKKYIQYNHECYRELLKYTE